MMRELVMVFTFLGALFHQMSDENSAPSKMIVWLLVIIIWMAELQLILYEGGI